jgi:hypothetical protein
MKRSAPLRRTKALRGNKPLRRLQRLRARSITNSYRRRTRDFNFMGFVKTRPCIVRELAPFLFLSTPEQASRFKATPCSGVVEADHAGARGIGQKADDRTCIPLCSSHHSQRTNHTGVFWLMTQHELRAWRARAIELTQAAWSNR